jgi:hypothetical protein
MLNISQGIKDGKVQTIIVPSNFNALMMPKWLQQEIDMVGWRKRQIADQADKDIRNNTFTVDQLRNLSYNK